MRCLQKPLLGLLLAAACAATSPAHADEVPYVPTPEVVVEAMLSMGQVTAQDNLVDLGSGDGRIVITAAKKHGASAVGIEYNPDLVLQSRENAAREGVSDHVTILQQDIFVSDISRATVVTMYLLPDVNLQLRPRILSELRPGTRIVSHDFDMGDWEPDAQREVEAFEKAVSLSRTSQVYLWIVPARAAGRWSGTLTGPDGKEPLVIDIAQRYQEATATCSLPGGSVKGTGRIRGESLTLALDRLTANNGKDPLRFDLKIRDNRMEGEARDGHQRYFLRAKRSMEEKRPILLDSPRAANPAAPQANPTP